MKKILSLFAFFCVISLGLLISKNSIQDPLGYTEMAWHLSYVGFTERILDPAITPLNFILVIIIQKLTHLAMNNAWKILDLTFGGLSAVFLINIFWKHQRSKKFIDLLFPIFIVLGSLMFWYPYTASTGEGATIFFSLIGTYLWSKYRFIHAIPFFILSFFAKHDFYLITPGLFIYSVFLLKKLDSKKIKQMIISGSVILFTLFLYHFVKNGGEFFGQASFSSGLKDYFIYNIPKTGSQFILSLFLGAPIAFIFFISKSKINNIFWLCGLSSLLVLTSRFYQWHYPTHIIAYMLLFMFTTINITNIIKWRFVLFQLLTTLIIVKLLPINAFSQTLIHKHFTTTESYQIENEIRKDYHGGKIGFYMNLRLDTPFPAYEISHMQPEWDFIIKDTEYIITPSAFIPQQVLIFKQCNYTYYSSVGRNIIYKVNCKK